VSAGASEGARTEAAALTVREALARGAAFLERKGIERGRFEAELILAQTLASTRVQLYMDLDRPLTPPERQQSRELIERRGRREPLAYVLGEWGFRRLTLTTDARALVPRPETEILVERALALVEGLPAPRVLDVGTGTGAIALAIANECPAAQVVAIDISPEALELARENAERTGLADRVELVQGDLFSGLAPGFDLVVSNPPYVLPEEIEALEPEVRDWEPRAALVGVGATEALARAARAALVPGGALAVELGDGQQRAYSELLGNLGFRDVTITSDLTGKERVVEARWQ
jgi:release factor glutamine methyltransferase